jgi:hypothetical protein
MKYFAIILIFLFSSLSAVHAQKDTAASNAYLPEYAKPYKNKTGIIDRIVYLNFSGVQKPLKFSDTVSWIAIATLILLLIAFLYVVTYFYHFLDISSNKKAELNRTGKENDNSTVPIDGVEKECASGILFLLSIFFPRN